MSLNPLVFLSTRLNKLNRLHVKLLVLIVSIVFYMGEAHGAYLIIYYGYERMPWLYTMFVLAFSIPYFGAFVAHYRLLRMGPGHVFPSQMLLKTVTVWDECAICHARRPLGTHHCRICDKCVLLRDHHCPWINNCVGKGNQWLFMLFSCYVAIGSGLCSLFLVEHLVNQSCSSCKYPETRSAAITSLVITLFCLMTSIGINTAQVINLATRAHEYAAEYKARQKTADGEDGNEDAEDSFDEAQIKAKLKKGVALDLVMEMYAWKRVVAEIQGEHLGSYGKILALTPFWIRIDPTVGLIAMV